MKNFYKISKNNGWWVLSDKDGPLYRRETLRDALVLLRKYGEPQFVAPMSWIVS